MSIIVGGVDLAIIDNRRLVWGLCRIELFLATLSKHFSKEIWFEIGHDVFGICCFVLLHD